MINTIVQAFTASGPTRTGLDILQATPLPARLAEDLLEAGRVPARAEDINARSAMLVGRELSDAEMRDTEAFLASFGWLV